MFDLINEILEEILGVQEALKNGNCHVAKAFFLDFCGDVAKLSKEDYNAACDLLWYEKTAEYLGCDIHGYYWNNPERCFQLVW